MDENGRTCTKCKQWKPWGEFHIDRAKYNGHCEKCKPCRNAETARYKKFRHVAERSKRPKEYAQNKIFAAKARAAKIGVPFDLHWRDIFPIPSHCPVLGIELEIGGSSRHNSPSLDRIIPARGYVRGNVVIISDLANRILSDATPAQVRKAADWFESVYPDDAWMDE